MASLSGAGAEQRGGQGMNNLTTLIKRLEAATSRLEDIANSSASESLEQQAHGGPSSSPERTGSPIARGSGGSPVASGDFQPTRELEPTRSAPELPGLAGGAGGSIADINGGHGAGQREASTSTVRKVDEQVPERIQAMDELLDTEVKAFVEASKGLDALVEEQATSVAKAFSDQRRFLLVSTKAKKPDPQSQTFTDLLSDLQQDMGAVGDIRDSNRASPMKEHLAMVGEGIGVLQWLLIEPKPADYVGEIIGGAQMYGNRVLKTYRETDQAHVKYVQAYYALLKALQSYIKKHYPSGVTWNNDSNADALEAYRGASSGPTPTANGARSPASALGAPPPPPPPLPSFDNAPHAASSASSSSTKLPGSSSDMGAVFDQLNRGGDVTKGLKKVDQSQMTHKNPSLRTTGASVPGSDNTSSGSLPLGADISRSRSPGGPEIKPKPASMRQNSTTSTSSQRRAEPKREPKKELDGNKWLVENYDSPSQPVELEVSLSQSILITKCKNTTIILRGKANAISIDNSPKTQLLVESLVSSIDVIKCPGFAVQITGMLPTIMLDQVDGASIYLSKESLGTEVFTSKCSSVNVVLPPEKEEDDSTEHALPEQIRTVVKGGKLISEIVEHAG